MFCVCVSQEVGGVAPFGNASTTALGSAELGYGVRGAGALLLWVIRCDNTETKADSWTQQVAGAALFLALGQGSWGPELTVLCCGEPSWACQNQLGLPSGCKPREAARPNTTFIKKDCLFYVCGHELPAKNKTKYQGRDESANS